MKTINIARNKYSFEKPWNTGGELGISDGVITIQWKLLKEKQSAQAIQRPKQKKETQIEQKMNN